MIKWELIKVGDILYDVHREKMGNTVMSRTGCWTVKIIEIDYEAETALISWNGNPPEKRYRYNLTKLRRSKPKQRPRF